MTVTIEPLSRIRPGQRARVVRMEVREELRRRCLHKAPLGDPAAYQIRGAVIALRQSDSAGILTTPV